jgi:probable F420-dependent oxidoreductase
MHPIRIAAQLHPQHGTWPDLRAGALLAEDMGYDIVYTWDHFFPLYGDRDGAHFECWSMLAALAEDTRRIELGPLVTCNSYRNPDLLADIARTVDHIGGGRTILGIGSGWAQRDYDAYGFEFGTRGSRLAALEAALPRIRHRLEVLQPPPLRPMPLLIAGVGERRTLGLVARYADAWHAAFPERIEQLHPKVDVLARRCEEIGRDPRTIEWAVGIEPDDLDRFLDEDVERYVALGFTQFTLGFNGPRWDVAAGERWLRFRDERNQPRGNADAAA